MGQSEATIYHTYREILSQFEAWREIIWECEAKSAACGLSGSSARRLERPGARGLYLPALQLLAFYCAMRNGLNPTGR